MAQYDVYKEIAERTDGSIYIGVVGPVRTGKSTFIRRFMDLMVVPDLSETWYRERLIDELPQSGGGKSIMTTQISFVPAEPIELEISPACTCSLRMVDCVGYMVDGAIGDSEDGRPRMVRTPWSNEEVTFKSAAENGTRKVIRDHATIGLVVTTDGSITDLPRSAYKEAEKRTINELKAIGKPFAVVLNSRSPYSDTARSIKDEIEKEYDIPVTALDVMNMDKDEIGALMENVLNEFNVRQIEIDTDDWVRALPDGNALLKELSALFMNACEGVKKLRDNPVFTEKLESSELVKNAAYQSIDAGSGTLHTEVQLPRELYYKVLSAECGMEISGDTELMSVLSSLSHGRQECERLLNAWEEVQRSGYGMIKPTMQELELAEPETMKQGGSFGVRLRAKAPSYHMLKIEVETEISPIVGTESQSEELLEYLLEGFKDDKAGIWRTQIFGRSMEELVRENLAQKLNRMPEDVRRRTVSALSKVINDGKGNYFCIVF